MMRFVVAFGAASCVAGCFAPSDRALMGEAVDAAADAADGEAGQNDGATQDARAWDSSDDAVGETGSCSPPGFACASNTDCCSLRCHETGHCQ
jgi:hypothetical protein